MSSIPISNKNSSFPISYSYKFARFFDCLYCEKNLLYNQAAFLPKSLKNKTPHLLMGCLVFKTKIELHGQRVANALECLANRLAERRDSWKQGDGDAS